MQSNGGQKRETGKNSGGTELQRNNRMIRISRT